ncbi:MAG: hypothetical protein HFI69_10985 [Lachnospiraceae bacterium]|nr:hypothetical protein [Lachnospiraceae bacterium]
MKHQKFSFIFFLFISILSAHFILGTMFPLKVSAAQKSAITITNKPSEPLYVGSRLRLQAKISSKKSASSKIVWSSSREKIATVSSGGLIKVHKKGTTKITARIKGTNKKTSFRLRAVKRVYVKKIAIRGRNQMYVGDSIQLTTLLSPDKVTESEILWKSDHKKIATVNKNGMVTAKKAGTVTITATEKRSGKVAKYRISVQNVPVVSINFSGGKLSSMGTGTTCRLSVSFTPWNTTNKRIKWSSSNNSAASVDQNGTVTALRPIEKVTITATSRDNSRVSCSLTLKITATDGFINTSMLDELDLDAINKVMIVAHPDDETLWGGAHILEDEYLIVCMTNGWNTARKNAFIDVMHKSNDKYIILSYPDTRVQFSDGSYETDTFSTCRTAMQKDIETILSYKNWEQVVTHNPTGEYGKYHHQQISKLVTKGFKKHFRYNSSELWYFGHFYGKDNIPGKQIDPQLLQIKNKMIQRYYATASGAINAFGHMIPYENWILSSEWENSLKQLKQ